MTVIGSNNAVITTIDVGDGPYGIAVSTDGTRVYTTNNGNTITVISTATNQVTGTIPIDPVGVAFHPDPDVHLAYAINQNDDHISVINTDSGEVTNVITAGDAPFGIAIAPDGHYAYVTNVGADTVTVIDLTDNNAIITSIDVGDEPHGIAVSQDGTRVYTANTASDSISVIETGTWRVLDTLDVGDEPSGVVLSSDGTKAYITLSADNQVATLFIAGNEAPLAVADPTAGAPDEDGVVTGRVNVFDPDGDTLTYAVTTQPIYGSVTFNEDDGTYTYTPGFEDRLTVSKTVAVETDSFTVRVSDGVNTPVDVAIPVGAVAELSRNTVVDTVGTGNFPLSVALSPNGSRAYVLNGGDDTVTVIDTATNTAIATIPVGNFTYAVAVSPLGDKVYATNIDDRTISVIDAASNTELTTIPFDGYPYAVAVSANGSRLYVTSREDGSISVFDTASNTLIDTLDVGDDQVADVAFEPGGFAELRRQHLRRDDHGDRR